MAPNRFGQLLPTLHEGTYYRYRRDTFNTVHCAPSDSEQSVLDKYTVCNILNKDFLHHVILTSLFIIFFLTIRVKYEIW